MQKIIEKILKKLLKLNSAIIIISFVFLLFFLNIFFPLIFYPFFIFLWFRIECKLNAVNTVNECIAIETTITFVHNINIDTLIQKIILYIFEKKKVIYRGIIIILPFIHICWSKNMQNKEANKVQNQTFSCQTLNFI